MTSIEEWVEPDFHQVNLDIEAHLKNERGYKLDAGELSPSYASHDTAANSV